MSEARSMPTRAAAPPAGRAAPGGGPRRLGLALLVIATAQLMVVLDATIVNVALPHIQKALGFSGSGLEWVVNAYALAFGGLLLLGGRSGDLLGRRKMFIAGLLLFSAASLAGGCGRPRGHRSCFGHDALLLSACARFRDSGISARSACESQGSPWARPV